MWIKAAGQTPFTPTIKGKRPGDLRTTGLAEAIQSIASLAGVSAVTRLQR